MGETIKAELAGKQRPRAALGQVLRRRGEVNARKGDFHRWGLEWRIHKKSSPSWAAAAAGKEEVGQASTPGAQQGSWWAPGGGGARRHRAR